MTNSASQPLWQKAFSPRVESQNTARLNKNKLREWQGREEESESGKYTRAGWTLADFEAGGRFEPLGVEGGIIRSLHNMQALADLLAAHRRSLTIVVYPWPTQLAADDRDSRQAAIWREFCVKNCKTFIN